MIKALSAVAIAALVAAAFTVLPGFAPNVEGYGLDKAGVALTDRKAIGISDYMRTNVPHIYAIGDVTGLLQLAHVAEAQGVVAWLQGAKHQVIHLVSETGYWMPPEGWSYKRFSLCGC